MGEIKETKCTECDFVNETFDEICDKYDVVVAGNVGQLTLEQKKTVIKKFVTLEKTKISESLDDDFKIAYLKQIKIKYLSLEAYVRNNINEIAKNMSQYEFNKFKKNYDKKEHLYLEAKYDEDNGFEIKRIESPLKTIFLNTMTLIGIATMILIMIKIGMMIIF